MMQHQILGDIQRSMRYGDENSKENCDRRKSAFNIVSMICTAFLPNHDAVGADIEIGNEFILEPDVIQIGGTACPAMALEFGGGYPFYWICPKGEFPEDRMISLKTAEYVEKRIREGWLQNMLKELAKQRSQEAAEKLGREFGIAA